MGRIAGLTLVKIDGIYELDALNVTWDVDKTVTQHATGGGLENAVGLQFPSGGMDEVIPLDGTGTDWSQKSDFRIDIYDKETRKKIVHSQSGCEWNKAGGNSENQSASTKQKISWKSKVVNKLTPAG